MEPVTPWVLFRFVVGWVHTFFWSSVCLVISLAGFPRVGWRFAVTIWAVWALKIIGVRIDITGRENLVGPALFVSNHESLIDVVFLPAVLPNRIKYIAKKELLKVPLWGPAFGTAGAIFIDRSNARAAIRSIRDGIKQLPEGWSVVIFPEGTRSRTMEMRQFKKGAFHMALQSRLPIVPIGMCGARAVVPSGAAVPRPGVIELTAGPPLSTEHWKNASVDEHMAEMRAAVQACVDASRRRYEKRFPDRMRALREDMAAEAAKDAVTA